MESAAGFEEAVNRFICERTGEKIYLDLATENNVKLRPLCQHGSIPLGVFWVHLFQHPNNYPIHKFPYKKLYREGSMYELKMRTDGISVTINLASGQLVFKGPHVIDWFVCRFPDIMSRYVSPPGQDPKELGELYTQEEMEALQKERERCYKHFLEEWPMSALERAANVMEAGRSKKNPEPVDPEGFLEGSDLETYSPVSDLLDEMETKEQLQRLESGKVVQGNVLYRLWKSTLNLWFSDEGGRVFIITPHIDCDRLTDVCMLFLKNKQTACLSTMCVPMNNLYERFADVRSKTIKRFPPRDQVMIEYKIYNSVVYPVVDFVTSFIAMVKDGKAQILQTNMDFERSRFVTTVSATALYKDMDEGQFLAAYLDPILV